MEITPQMRASILEDMARPQADVYKISRTYGVPSRLIRDLVGAPPIAVAINEINGGLGRPSMQEFIVSRRRANRDWPPEDTQKIVAARADYDAGTIEMATGRDGDWLILYAIPRVNPDLGRRPYFTTQDEDVAYAG